MDLFDGGIPLLVNDLHDLFFGVLPFPRRLEPDKKAEIVFGDRRRKKRDIRDLGEDLFDLRHRFIVGFKPRSGKGEGHYRKLIFFKSGGKIDGRPGQHKNGNQAER